MAQLSEDTWLMDFAVPQRPNWHNLDMKILRMRRGTIEADKSALFSSFVEGLQATMRPLIQPGRELLASRLGIDHEVLVWSAAQKPDQLRRDTESYAAAEVFVLDGGLLIVGMRSRSSRLRYVENADGSVSRVTDGAASSTVEVDAFVSPHKMSMLCSTAYPK